MELSDKRVAITGGAGFLGSHLAASLNQSNTVIVIDDLSNGNHRWVPPGTTFHKGDLTNRSFVMDAFDADIDIVFHFAARKNVNDPAPRDQFESNIEMTYNILEGMEKNGISDFAFASSSTVYGEAPRPTPEGYPGEPISPYGAAKSAEEGLCSVFAHSYQFTVWIFRFANVVGPRLQAGSVLVDFIAKLRDDPETLEILGDGRQEKSYLYLDDCIEAMQFVVENTDDPTNIFNLGTKSTTSVTTIADIIAEEMDLNPTYNFTGGDRGWVGDVPRMRLSIDRLESIGWSPQYSSDEAIRQATRRLIPTNSSHP